MPSEAQEHRQQGLGQSDSAGSITLKLPRSQGKPARSVTLSVRFVDAAIAVPRHKAKYLKMEAPVQASIIKLREEGV
jgi:hypothetical protein